MKLPDKIPMQAVLYGDGAKGLAFQITRNDELGVQCEARREKRGAAWIETWTCDHLPQHEFKTYRELQAAVQSVAPAPFAPTVISVEPKRPGSSGDCWLCRGEWVHDVRVKVGWREADEEIIPTCDADLEAVKADPLAAIEARRKHVREHPLV